MSATNETQATQPTGWSPIRILGLVAVVVLIVGLGVGGWIRLRPRQDGTGPSTVGADVPPDPRLSYDGPFENIHPSVGYTGTASCATCHAEYAASYARHPMGRSTVKIQELASKQVYDEKHNNPFLARGLRLQVDRQGEHVFHTHAQLAEGKPIWEVRRQVQFAVGSGTRGYSYLAEVDGFVYQTNISWFGQKHIWDLSPGYRQILSPGRRIGTGCLQCHVNRTRDRPGYLDRYEDGVFEGCAIGCERCHGPGQKHVAFRENLELPEGRVDPTIVNPAHLDWKLRDNVCEQCHVSGEARVLRRGVGWYDYRPGMPLEAFLRVYIKNPALPGTHKAVGHVEQMRKSKCYTRTEGAGKLGCISCHDPHEKPEPKLAAAYFRKRCLNCHQEKDCSQPRAERLRVSPGDACTSCHMPRAPAQDIAHTALTEHGIIRPGKRETSPMKPLAPDELPIVSLSGEPMDSKDPEHQRELGIALMRLVRTNKVPPHALSAVTSRAIGLLEEPLRKHPTDPLGWQALGEAYGFDQRPEDALSAYERAIQLQPNNDEMLQQLATLELNRGRTNEAIEYLRRVVEVNPSDPDYRQALGKALAQKEDWAGVEAQARAWIGIDPGKPMAHQLLVVALLEKGDRAGARRAFEMLRKLKPANLPSLEAWFARRAG